MNRRKFSRQLLSAVSSYALLESLFSTSAFTHAVSPLTDHWAVQLNTYCQDLRKTAITPEEWQAQVEALYDKIELTELLRFIDFANLKKGFQFPDLGVDTRRVLFPELTGLPARTAFVKKIFGMKKGRAIIPHGHSNMASAHLILEGELHLRHYEKVRQEADMMIIRPSIDKTVGPGSNSSISDEQDNVHWFVSNTPTAFTFDVIMLDLEGQQYDIHNLDMYEKVDLSDGTMRVPILDVQTALAKYGKTAHH